MNEEQASQTIINKDDGVKEDASESCISKGGGKAEDSSSSSKETPEELARWNRLGTTMEYFHNYFKSEFNEIYQLSDGSFSDHGMTLQMFIRKIGGWKKHLETHHGIEERFFFPVLAKRMPAFADNEQHRTSHEGIHKGLDDIGELMGKWRETPSSYSPKALQDCLDSFRDVLMRHLDEEVQDLKAENMKKYWTLQEVDRIVV